MKSIKNITKKIIESTEKGKTYTKGKSNKKPQVFS